MRDWPPITEPELLERLALDDEQFAAYLRLVAGAFGRREYGPALLRRALDYPWERPARSYVLRGDEVQALDDLDGARRRSTIDAFVEDRHPILAIGSNASPGTLTAKFAHFPDAADRAILVLAGDLHDLDVGASASPTAYGALPAALFASPGTAVRSAVLWCTATQVTQLTWSEVGYRLGRLDSARFVIDEADVEVDGLFAYVSRFGALCIDGQPIALAAVPATRRTAVALTQEQSLDAVARLMLGAGTRAEDLVRAVFEDMAGVLALAEERVWSLGRHLAREQWTALPVGRTQPRSRQ